MDSLKKSEITDSTVVHVSTYPATIAEAFQRANSYQVGHTKITKGAVIDSHQTVFTSDTATATSNKKDEEKKKLIRHAEWIKITVEQQDAVKAILQNTVAIFIPRCVHL